MYTRVVCSFPHYRMLHSFLYTTYVLPFCTCRNPITTGAVLTPYDKEIVCRACATVTTSRAPTRRLGLPGQVTSTLAYMSEQRKSLSPPSVISPYSTLSSSSNISNTSSSSNGPFSPSATAQSLISNRHPSSPPPAVDSSNHAPTMSAYGKRRSTSDILDIPDPDQPVTTARRQSSSGASQPPISSTSMYSNGSSQRNPNENHQRSFSFEQKGAPEMSNAYTAVTEPDGQLKLKPVEPQVKAKLGCELHSLTAMSPLVLHFALFAVVTYGTLSAFLGTHPL